MTTAAGPTATRRRFRPELLIEVPAVVVVFVMMLHVTGNALLRTFARNPLPNTLEMVQYWYLPIVAFLGFVAAQHRGQHIAADLVFERLPHAVRPYLQSFMYLLCTVVCAGFAWYGWGEALHAYNITRTAGVSTLISWPTYFLPPFAFGVLTVQFLLASVWAVTRPASEIPTGPSEPVVLDEAGDSIPTVDRGTK